MVLSWNGIAKERNDRGEFWPASERDGIKCPCETPTSPNKSIFGTCLGAKIKARD